MARQQNTYAKRARETEKKRKAEEKLAKRKQRQTDPPPLPPQSAVFPADDPA